MDLDQKVGAVLTLGFIGTVIRPHIYDAILKYHCGGLRLSPAARLFGSYVDPKSGKTIMDISERNVFNYTDVKKNQYKSLYLNKLYGSFFLAASLSRKKLRGAKCKRSYSKANTLLFERERPYNRSKKFLEVSPSPHVLTMWIDCRGVLKRTKFFIHHNPHSFFK
jgi:hypothetical protein